MTRTQISSISKNYANALLTSAKESNSTELIKQQFEQIIETINISYDLKVVMDNSSVTYTKKKEILDELFSGKIDIKILNLLKILVEKNRFSEIQNIYSAYVEMTEKLSNTKNVEIISSVNLDDKVKDKILNKLQEKLNSNIVPNWQTDENIIAGLIFKIDDYVIDTSVASKLTNLGKNILR